MRSMTSDATETQKISIDYYQRLYANKLIQKNFLETLPKLNCEETGTLTGIKCVER